jgi:multiple inositol-polyphosphate phosphatase/2,3-bisphosphoglycerate 3-phosphatase
VEHNQVKSISAEGRMELQGIAKRMFAQYPQVFKGAPKLNVTITKEIRTKQSADAFLGGLKAGFKDSALIKESNDDTNLRFYDASPTYTAFEESGSWQKQMTALQQQLKLAAVNNQIVEGWLTAVAFNKLKAEEVGKLVADVFGFATIVASLQSEAKQAGLKPADVDFAPLFTCTQLIVLSKIDVADDYLKKGPGTDNNGIQVRIAAPLLANFITTADAFIQGDNTNAQLRFAHAETISPFATLLGISQASVVANDITKLDAAWQSSKVIPLSANIQWIFYRKKGGSDLLVKVLLNEKESHINGLVTGSFPYYKWSNLRKFYVDKLNKLHVGLSDDMQQYLSTVK